MTKYLKQTIKKIINSLGFDIIKLHNISPAITPYCDYGKSKQNIIDIDKLGQMSLSINGMITPESGKYLFVLCYMQEEKGDVVEIGSWQGRSTSFLARAVKESKNGQFYAIDHFGGNIGKEKYYAVNGSINGLKDNFINNMERFGLNESIHLLDMYNVDAAEIIGDRIIRFLFIDGDHTKSGVNKDIKLFFPKLAKGSIVVFDDYFDGFPGLIEAVEEIINEYEFSRILYYRHTLILKL